MPTEWIDGMEVVIGRNGEVCVQGVSLPAHPGTFHLAIGIQDPDPDTEPCRMLHATAHLNRDQSLRLRDMLNEALSRAQGGSIG